MSFYTFASIFLQLRIQTVGVLIIVFTLISVNIYSEMQTLLFYLHRGRGVF